MSASIASDPMTVSIEPLQTNNIKLNSSVNEYEYEYEYEYETESAECNCCGLKEEYTKAYIERVKQRYNDTWICGLCSEAIKDEIVRSDRLLSTEEAMQMHMAFCGSFKSSGPPPNPAVHLITAMRQILRRSLESPRALRSLPSSPTREKVAVKSLVRSESCFLPIVADQDDECKLGC